MKFHLLSIALFLSITSFAKPDQSAELSAFVNKFAGNINIAGDVYKQSMSVKPGKDFYTTIRVDYTNSRGKQSKTKYDFYLMHLNPEKVNLNISGKEILLAFNTANGEDIIKVTSEGELNGFTNTFNIYFDDIQLAREAKAKFEALIKNAPVEPLGFNDLPEVFAWLQKHCSNLDIGGGEQITQNFAIDTDMRNRVEVSISESGSTEKYQFYLSDFDKINESLKVRNNTLRLDLETSEGIQSLKYFQDGEQKNYTNSFTLYHTDPKLAYQMARALNIAIALHKGESTDELETVAQPKPGDEPESTGLFSRSSGNDEEDEEEERLTVRERHQQRMEEMKAERGGGSSAGNTNAIEVNNAYKVSELNIEEPEWEGTIIFVDKPNGEGKSLERQNGSKETKGAMAASFGGKIKGRLVVDGSNSPFRIQGDVFQFIYKFKNNRVNPRDIIQLYKLESRRKDRIIELASVGMTGSSSGDIDFIEFDAASYGEASYLITVKNLEPGEYGFSLGDEETVVVHLFGVD